MSGAEYDLSWLTGHHELKFLLYAGNSRCQNRVVVVVLFALLKQELTCLTYE